MTIRLDPRDIDAYWRHIHGSAHSGARRAPPSDAWITENVRAILLFAAGLGSTAHARLTEEYPNSLNRILTTNPFKLYLDTNLVTFDQAVFLFRRCEQKDSATLACAARARGLRALALVLAGLGEREPALDELERACEQRSRFAAFLGVWPIFDDLRELPRFQDLLRRVGLPPGTGQPRSVPSPPLPG